MLAAVVEDPSARPWLRVQLDYPGSGDDVRRRPRRLDRGMFMSFSSQSAEEDERPEGPDRGPRVLVAATQPALVDGLCGWLNRPGVGLRATGTCVAAADLSDTVTRHGPVLVVTTDELASAATVAEINTANPQVLVMVLVAGDNPRRDASMVRSGAGAVVPITADRQRVVRAIYALLDGQAVVSAAALSLVAGNTPNDTPSLTQRQREVLEILAGGNSTAQIAERLVVTPSTVKTHIRQIGERFGVTGHLAIAVNARQLLDSGITSQTI